jgi:hypothetical protein
LGGGRWRVMHYMIMDSKLRYNCTQNYNLEYFLLLHKADVKVGNVWTSSKPVDFTFQGIELAVTLGFTH